MATSGRGSPGRREPVGSRACSCKSTSPLRSWPHTAVFPFSGGSSVLLGVWKGFFLEPKGLVSPCSQFFPASVSCLSLTSWRKQYCSIVASPLALLFIPKSSVSTPQLCRYGCANAACPLVPYAFPSLSEYERTAPRCLHRPLRGAQKIETHAEIMEIWWHKIFFHMKKSTFRPVFPSFLGWGEHLIPAKRSSHG